ncbi:MAG TPA: PP2C family protein-serine/threonine phosphatase [Vicinamibacteria bacterium]|nr:PP2C family protein-serine/threonine phosphatase [Vicinamibacteria bacterium]
MKRTVPVLYAVVSAIVAFVAALLFERGLIRLLGLDLRELEWISDVVLAVAFGAATFLWLHLRRARTALTRLERSQVILDTELAIAADIQHGLLPPPPPGRGGWRFAARLEQAGHIGGDFYDFVDRGRSLLVLLADVSGKGIPAALVMASARALFRQIARETDLPDELLTRLGRSLWDEHGGTPYLTAFLARLDLDGRSLSWVNAGHPAALLVTGAGHRALGSTGPPAGLLPGTRYEAESLSVGAGDALVLVTDGVTEALEAVGRVEERLAWTIAQRRTRGPEGICDRVMRIAQAGRGPVGAGDWQDDRTVVTVTLDEP